MKKTLTLLACLVIAGTGFYGCKKGEGDPALSMHTRKGRLTGDWDISAGTYSKTDTDPSGTDVLTTTWSGTSVTQVYSSGGTSSTSIGTGSYKMSIVKDGTWTSTQQITWTGTPSFIENSTTSGTWNWTSGVGETKNKSQIVMRTLSSQSTFGTATSIATYTLDNAPATIYNISQLKNKEIIFHNEGTSLMGTTTSSTKEDYTFTQGK